MKKLTMATKKCCAVTDTNRDAITGTLNSWSLTATTGVSATAALDEAFAEFAVELTVRTLTLPLAVGPTCSVKRRLST